MKYADIKVGDLVLVHYLPTYSKNYRVESAQLARVVEVGVHKRYAVRERGWSGATRYREDHKGIRVRYANPDQARTPVSGRTQEEAIEATELVTRADRLQPYTGSNKERWDEAQARRRMRESRLEAKAAANRELIHELNDYLPTEWRWGVDEDGTIRVDNIEGRLRAIVAALRTGAYKERTR